MKLKVILSVVLALAMSLNVYADGGEGENDEPDLPPPTFPIPHRAPRVKPAVVVDNQGNGFATILFNKAVENVEIEYYSDGILVGINSYGSLEASTILFISGFFYGADSFAVLIDGNEVYADEF